VRYGNRKRKRKGLESAIGCDYMNCNRKRDELGDQCSENVKKLDSECVAMVEASDLPTLYSTVVNSLCGGEVLYDEYLQNLQTEFHCNGLLKNPGKYDTCGGAHMTKYHDLAEQCGGGVAATNTVAGKGKLADGGKDMKAKKTRGQASHVKASGKKNSRLFRFHAANDDSDSEGGYETSAVFSSPKISEHWEGTNDTTYGTFRCDSKR